MRFCELVAEWSCRFYSQNTADENFLTLPKISESFALAVLSKIKEFKSTEEIKNISVIELGAGDGELAFSLIKYAEEFEITIEKMILVESSEIRREKIRRKFEEIPNKKNSVITCSTLDELMRENIKVDVTIANEFFDSLPFSVILYDSDRTFKELLLEMNHVPAPEISPFFGDVSAEALSFIREYIKEDTLEAISRGHPVVFEICELFPYYVKSIKEISKIAIISDYGYRYFYQRTPYGSATLHWRYRAEKLEFHNLEKLKNQISEGFGKKDISFFVDFEILEKLFELEGCKTHVYRLSHFVAHNLMKAPEDVLSSFLLGKDRERNILGFFDSLYGWGNFFVLTVVRDNNGNSSTS